MQLQWHEKFKVLINNRWLVLVCATWVQSCAGVGYLFGSISPVIKSAMGYDQRQVAFLGVAKDLGDSVGFVAGSLCEVLPIWVILLIGVVQNFVGYGLVWLVIAGVLPALPLWVVSLINFSFVHFFLFVWFKFNFSFGSMEEFDFYYWILINALFLYEILSLSLSLSWWSSSAILQWWWVNVMWSDMYANCQNLCPFFC